MAGRGRGRRLMTLSVEAVGVTRGDTLPPSVQQPTPVFPVLEQKPLPLADGEEAEYLLALKQEFRGAMRSLPCFIQPSAAKKDVERYSDKYHVGDTADGLMDWTPDWTKLPKELRLYEKKKLHRGAPLQPAQKKKQVKDKQEVLLRLETLEKKEEQQRSEEEGEEKKKEEEEEGEPEEEYDEEELEEETDYIMSYFDNGEEFGGDSDDNMDEAVY